MHIRMPFITRMRATLAMALLVGTSCFVGAQEVKAPAVTSTNAAAAASAEVSSPPAESMRLAASLELQDKSSWTSQSSTSTVTGPLVEPFRAPKASQVPKRFLQLFNPFAPVAQPAPHRTVAKDVSAQPWSSVVGWRPGQSQFTDVTTHEPSVSVIVVNCSK